MTPVFDLRRFSVLSRVSVLKSTALPRSQSDTTYNGLASLKPNRRVSDLTETMTILPAEEKEEEEEDIENEEESVIVLRPLQISNDNSEVEKNSLLYRRLYRGRASPKSSAHSSTTSSKDVSRSQSMKFLRKNTLTSEAKRRYRGSSIPNEVIAHGAKVQQRTVSNRSLPLPGEDINYTRLRNFSITSKGVINRGDSFRSSTYHITSGILDIGKVPTQNNFDDVESLTSNSTAYKVLLIGAPDVGKTSLKNQFMTSEYICSYDGLQDEARAVNIILNNEESKLEFEEEEVEENEFCDIVTESQADAYVIVYSVTNRRSYLQARRLLEQVSALINQKAVILVGNKTDLVRLRSVNTEEGRALAKDKGCKFIETSVAINHQVDELLVGVLTQIRMKHQLVEKKTINKYKRKDSHNRKSSIYPGTKACGVLKKILQRTCLKSKSCDNLHVL